MVSLVQSRNSTNHVHLVPDQCTLFQYFHKEHHLVPELDVVELVFFLQEIVPPALGAGASFLQTVGEVLGLERPCDGLLGQRLAVAVNLLKKVEVGNFNFFNYCPKTPT